MKITPIRKKSKKQSIIDREVADINNITYHCLTCHTKWERGVSANELYDYHSNMQYIKSVDEQYYHIREQKTQ